MQSVILISGKNSFLNLNNLLLRSEMSSVLTSKSRGVDPSLRATIMEKVVIKEDSQYCH